MMSKLFYAIFFLGLISCGHMGCNNQSEGIFIADYDYDFGVIPDTIRTLTHRFTIKNTTNDTCRILRIEKSCGCTKVKESTSVIAPHSFAYLDVEVDLGTVYNFFERDINVYTDVLDEPMTIFIRASRNMPRYIVNKEFPVKVSNNLRINVPYVIMGNICLGDSKMSTINMINTNSENVSISARIDGAPSFVNVYCDEVLKPNDYGRIIVSIDLTNTRDIWGLQKYTLVLESDKNKLDIPVEAIFVDNLSTDKEHPKLLAPVANYTVDTSKDSIVHFAIENIGKDNLYIRDIKKDGSLKQLSIGSYKLSPNSKDSIMVSLKSGQEGTIVIGVSSNDPIQPYKEFRIFCQPNRNT